MDFNNEIISALQQTIILNKIQLEKVTTEADKEELQDNINECERIIKDLLSVW